MKHLALAAAALAVVLTGSACTPPASTADPNLKPSASASKTTKKTTAKKTEEPSEEPADDGLVAVTYKIAGSASSGMITYTTPSGMEQTTRRVPWSKTLKVDSGEFLSLSAQNSGGGTIICEIWVDGQLLKRAKSSGEYTIASCDGMAG